MITFSAVRPMAGLGDRPLATEAMIEIKRHPFSYSISDGF